MLRISQTAPTVINLGGGPGRGSRPPTLSLFWQTRKPFQMRTKSPCSPQPLEGAVGCASPFNHNHPATSIFLRGAACVPRRSRAKLFGQRISEKMDFPEVQTFTKSSNSKTSELIKNRSFLMSVEGRRTQASHESHWVSRYH